jgi:hypothetical protein
LSVAGTYGGSNVGLEINISTSAAPVNSIEFTINGNNTTYFRISTNSAISINTWYHVAVTRISGTIYCFLNGVLQTSSTSGASTNINGSGGVTIAAAIGGGGYWPGYVSNVRILKGTALYTASFTPPTAPLTAIANTQLLTCQSATIIDNSTNNFTITNNNSATVSSAITPFSASLAYGGTNFKKNIYPRVGRSVQFNGTNQYLSVANNAAFNFGTGNYTVEGWFYWTSVPANARPFTNGQSAGSFQFYWDGGTYTANKLTISNRIANQLQVSFLPVVNTWYHIAAVRNSGTVAIYVNGTNLGSIADSNNYSTSAVFNIGGDVGNGGTWFFPGYISNVRVVNGTAVYTSNFTPSTSPLTAIANTSLLTCQSPTIIDNSSNNFTITNNNTAVVSTTNPFGADTTGGGMGMKKSAAVVYLTQKAIFGYGNLYSITNLVSNTGVVSTDTTGVGTARYLIAAAGYGGDKAMFGYGTSNEIAAFSMTNLVSNTGVVSTDTAGVGTSRWGPAAACYGSDKAIFGYGFNGSTNYSITNLVSNTGVVATDTPGVGTARYLLAAAKYGSDKAIFGYGNIGFTTVYSMTNLVSNTGVVANDTTGVGTARWGLAAAGYGSDKAIFGYGYNSSSINVSITNLVSNTGVVATDTTGVGTARRVIAAAGYGSDKAIFGYGYTTGAVSITNLVNNSGVVATDTTGVGTARWGLTAAGYSLT